jgi:hypothetical protein
MPGQATVPAASCPYKARWLCVPAVLQTEVFETARHTPKSMPECLFIASHCGRYLERFKVYVSAFETSPCGIQWMRFEPDSPVHALVKSVPHIAFEVDDLDAAITGKEILTEPNSPSEGVVVAMILDSGAPVELLQFRRDADS